MPEAVEPGMVEATEAVKPGMVGEPGVSNARMEPDMRAPMRHRAHMRAGESRSSLRLGIRWHRERPTHDEAGRQRYCHFA